MNNALTDIPVAIALAEKARTTIEELTKALRLIATTKTTINRQKTVNHINRRNLDDFDAAEWHPVVIYTDERGDTNQEQTPDIDEAEAIAQEYGGKVIFSVFLHLKEGGLDCIADCEDAADAEMLCASMQNTLNEWQGNSY